MLKQIILSVLGLGFFIFPTMTLAHVAGQPPFFKINGVFSELYPVPTSSLAEFRLPQDKPPALYLVNDEIHFEMDTASLPVPPEVVKVSEFKWDFGDKSEFGTGLKNSHTYTKPGSYFMEITVQTRDIPMPQLIQSVVVHVVPHKDYVLPHAEIRVNGRGVKDPLLDDIKVPFGPEMTLDGSQSQIGSSKIAEYIWDLGDGKSTKGEKIPYSYDSAQYAFFPVLRVVDEEGLISDAFIQITNSESELAGSEPTLVNHLHRDLGFIVGGIGVGLGLIFIPYLYTKRTQKNKKEAR